MDDRVDLLVVGAGVIGLACAWRAARAGLRVRVLERGRVGVGATSAAAGILAPGAAAGWRDARNVEALRRWPAFAADLEAAAGVPLGLRADGLLHLARDDRERDGLDALAGALGEAGVDHERLDADGVAAREPGVRGAVAGLLVPGVAHVEGGRLLDALARACAHAGARLDEGVAPSGLLRAADGAVRGVRLADGRALPARLTVAALGAWSATAAWLPEEVRPEVRPLAGEYLLLEGPAACRHVIRTPDGSAVPRAGGRLWLGTTVRDAGLVAVPDDAALAAIRARWAEVLPATARLALAGAGVGLRPASVEGAPIVGQSGLDGLALATGHGREGVLQAPLAAAAVVDLATGRLRRSTPKSPKPDRT